RISSCRRPIALVAQSSERNEFEHTSSARLSVLCAAVLRTGRISKSRTGTFRWAICQAASAPARPPPMTWIGRMLGVVGQFVVCVNPTFHSRGRGHARRVCRAACELVAEPSGHGRRYRSGGGGRVPELGTVGAEHGRPHLLSRLQLQFPHRDRHL